WKIGGLGALEDFIDVVAAPTEQVREIWPVGYQASCFDITARAVHRRQPRGQRQSINMDLIVCGHRIANNIERLRAPIKRADDRRDFIRADHIQTDDFKSEFLCGRKNLVHRQLGGGIVGTGENREPAKTVKDIAQNFEPLADEVGLLIRQSSDVAARMGERSNQAFADGVGRKWEDDRYGGVVFFAATMAGVP